MITNEVQYCLLIKEHTEGKKRVKNDLKESTVEITVNKK